jgi:hypothetical protein
MMKHSLYVVAAFVGTCFLLASGRAQDRTPPASAEERESAYTAMIERRASGIVAQLGLSDAAKSNAVMQTILNQYRALRSRDEWLDTKLKAQGPGAVADRAALIRAETKPVHDRFLAALAADLTPEQVEQVKDGMTYGKVKFTYDAYCSIVPGLTDQDKAKILELLKQAREEAIDGGNSKEKSDIFQKYKDQINAYLDAHGHDVAKAYREWNAKKEELEKKKQAEAVTKAAEAAK